MNEMAAEGRNFNAVLKEGNRNAVGFGAPEGNQNCASRGVTRKVKFELYVQFCLENLKGFISMPKFLIKQSTSSLVSEGNKYMMSTFNRKNDDDLDGEVTKQLNASRNSFFDQTK